MNPLIRGAAFLLASFLLVRSSYGLSGPSPGAVSASTLSLPSKPASVKGLADDASVSVFSGQVTYSIPLDLPAGRGGFSPSISLSYLGELGNGPAGIGWSLGSFAIKRSLRNGVPHYSEADEFDLVGIAGGGRLIRSPDGSNKFWVEGQGNTISVTFNGGGWLVVDGSGVRYKLGFTPDSIQGDGARVSAWFVSSVQDLTGLQTIRYSYVRDQGEVYLKNITWGPDRPAPAFSLEVALEDRSDVVTSWSTGFRIQTRRRIDRLIVHSFDEVLRSLDLTYEDQLGAGETMFSLSRLARVSLSGHDSNPSDSKPPLSLPPLNFQYVRPTPAEVKPLEGTGGWKLEERGVSVFDVDGDGMSDLLRTELGNHEWRKNRGGRYDDPRALPGAGDTDFGDIRFMDLDGDSRPELVRIVDDTWRVYRLVGSGNSFRWEGIGEWPGTAGVPLKDPAWVFADLNGDGSTDAVQGSAGAILVRFGTHTGLLPPKRLPQISPSDSTVEPGHPYVRFEDVNGDKLADVMWLTDDWIKVWLGRGDGTFETFARISYPWGKGAFPASDVQFADLDRDGLTDIVRFTAGHVQWFPGKPDGTFDRDRLRLVPRPSGVAFDAVVTMADVNGNGSQELVWSAPNGLFGLDLAGTGTAGMLQVIDNGLGKRTTFSYLSSATLSIQAENVDLPWEHKLPSSIPVPVSVEIDPEYRPGDETTGGPTRFVRYRVSNGVWDGKERRFAGFLNSLRTVPAEKPSDVLQEETRFLAGLGDDRALRGKPWLVETRSEAGERFLRSTTQWEARPVAGTPTSPLTRKAAQVWTESFSYQGVTEPIKTRSEFEYDDQVRVVAEHHFGRTDMQGDEKEVRRSFTDDPQRGLRDVACEELLLEGNGSTLLSRSRTFYTDASNGVLTTFSDTSATTASPCSGVGFGWVKKTEAWLNTESRWVVQNESSYDAFGNETQALNAGVRRSLAYDGLHFRPVSESVSPETNRTLSWTMTWNDVLGQPKTLKEPGGDETIVDYDDLGRLISVRSGEHQPHTRYSYDWTAPRPLTTTKVWDRAIEVTPANANVDGWRESTIVTNGAGEDLFSATRLSNDRWIVNGWKERDQRGRVVVVAEPFYHGATSLPTARPQSGFSAQTLTWDALDRVLVHALPNGGGRSMVYRAYEQTVASSETAPVTSILDGSSRIVRTTRAIDGVEESVQASYDAADRISLIRLQDGEADQGFVYDTLGRLTSATHPDIGDRVMTYNDAGWLTSHRNGQGETVRFTYDEAGRLKSRAQLDKPASRYEFHYDLPYAGSLGLERCPTSGAEKSRLASRLSWVTEPAGEVCARYDDLGREDFSARAIRGPDGRTERTWQEETFAASGLLLRQQYKDDFVIEPSYDRAGRPIEVKNGSFSFWSAMDASDGTAALDAAGRPLRERFGNGVVQTQTRDSLGLASSIAITGPATQPLYNVNIGRNSFGAPQLVTDNLATVGLDHNATFAYDGAARLIGATQGAAGPGRFIFRYQYDGLQNMIARAVTGPKSIGVLDGIYRHGSPGNGPRRLTKVLGPQSEVLCGEDLKRQFAYDGAGRMTSDGEHTMSFDAFDQLVSVVKQGGTTVDYGYGYDGLRTLKAVGGVSKEFFFDEGHVIRGNVAEHVVTVGARTIARVRGPPGSGGGASNVVWVPPARILRLPVADFVMGTTVLAVGLMMLVLGVASARRGRGWVGGTAGVAAAAVLTACSLGGCGSVIDDRASAWSTASYTFIHTGVAAGPVLFTDGAGEVLDERRYEPFGQPIDSTARAMPEAGQAPIDFRLEPLNALNKETDPETGWSYHGSRWMASNVASWLSPDPPTKAPSADFMATPWDLHPYQFVRQSPTLYWDPNGEAINWMQALDKVSNAVAGFGDAVSFGATDLIRDAIGVNDVVEKDTLAYQGGSVAGEVYSAALNAASGGAAAAGKAALKAGVEIGAERVVEKIAPGASGAVGVLTSAASGGRGGGRGRGNLSPSALPAVGNNSSLAKIGAKRGPKTDVNAPHNKKIREVADGLPPGSKVIAGGGQRNEKLIPTPGGKKGGRRPDVLYETPEGERRGINVGKTKVDGSPIKREAEALSDLNGPGGLPTDFVPYDR